jgi:hypothetical protein
MLENTASGADGVVLKRIWDAFGPVERPEHFTNHTHCDECHEHDELLRARDRHTLSITDVGSMAWNPITMCTPRGFAYYMPALARLALEPVPKEQDWYGYIILFELRWNGPRNERWLYCSPGQRAAIVGLIEHLYSSREKEIQLYDCSNEVMEVLEIWSDVGKNKI